MRSLLCCATADFEIGFGFGDFLVQNDADNFEFEPLIRGTREHPSLQFGASPRSANMLASAARAYAALNGRDFVIPDDVKYLAMPTLRHRVVVAPGAEIEGLGVDQVIGQIVDRIAAPR